VRFLTKKRVAAAAAAVFVSGGAMAAYAFWTGGGSGSGSASATTPSAVTVNQSTSVTGLYPGATAVTLSGTFDNPNSGGVFIHNVTAAVHAFSIQTDATKPACTQADFAIGGSATLDANVAAGNGVGAWTGLTVRLLNGAGNQDNCKSQAITIDYTANGS
jgi:hypothetical protein